MAPHPGWRDGGPGLSGVLLYVVIFALVFVGLPALIVCHRVAPFPRRVPEFTVRLLREDIGQIVEISLEDYLIGVVAAEMPADFHLEALKAQAVAARTYTLYCLGWQPGEPGAFLSTDGAPISTDYRSGQAWLSPEALRERWGWQQYYQKYRRIKRAVTQTRGQVLIYGGKPIFAAYHSTSGGATQDSAAYFADLPYLQGVPSPGEEISPYYRTTTFVSWREMGEKLGLAIPQDWRPSGAPAEPGVEGDAPARVAEPGTEMKAPNEGPDPAPSLTFIVADGDGGVQSLELMGRGFGSRTLREKLGLRSNRFTVEPQDGGLVFHVKGYGHGVGMSQYGAQAMALQGIDYQGILCHYYTEVKLVYGY